MASTDEQKLAKCFHRLGWIGFWVQAALAILSIAMLTYVVLGKATGARVTLGFMDYLALVGLAILAFTTLWSYRYTLLARRIAEPSRRPTGVAIAKTLWVGLWASCIGIFVSVLLLIIEVVRILFLFLKTPQAGVPVIRTEVDNRTSWVSAVDVVTLLAELCTLVGELVILGFTLWLLFAVTQRSRLWGEKGAPTDRS